MEIPPTQMVPPDPVVWETATAGFRFWPPCAESGMKPDR